MSGQINLFKRLQALRPEQPVYTGTVNAVFSDSSARVALDGGGYLMAKNPLQIAASKKVYVQDHVITGQAPDLPYHRVEI